MFDIQMQYFFYVCMQTCLRMDGIYECVRVRVRAPVYAWLKLVNSCEGACVLFVFNSYTVVVRGSSVIECRTRNQVSPCSNPPLLPFGRLGIFLLSIDAPVDSAV